MTWKFLLNLQAGNETTSCLILNIVGDTLNAWDKISIITRNTLTYFVSWNVTGMFRITCSAWFHI